MIQIAKIEGSINDYRAEGNKITCEIVIHFRDGTTLTLKAAVTNPARHELTQQEAIAIDLETHSERKELDRGVSEAIALAAQSEAFRLLKAIMQEVIEPLPSIEQLGDQDEGPTMTKAETRPDQGKRTYEIFSDWRVQLFDVLVTEQIHTEYLRLMRNDMQYTLEVLDKEISQRDNESKQ